MDSILVLLFSLLCKLSDLAVLISLVSIQLVIVFCLKTREVAQPRCGPARPGTKPGEDGGTLTCTGASLGSRTHLCLPGKLRESEAAGAAAVVPQRGRLVQGSQPGPALMLGPAAHGPRAGPGGAPHSPSATDCASCSARSRTISSLPLPAPQSLIRQAPSQTLRRR